MSDFLTAARWTDRDERRPHQDAAWAWAWGLLSKEQQGEFLEMFRAAPEVPEQSVMEVGNTWEGIRQAAARHGARYPEVVAAQWALESGRGSAMSGRNNPFGLKGTSSGNASLHSTFEEVKGRKEAVKDWFKDFESLDAAVRYLVERWYKDFQSPNGEKYQGVNRAGSREEAAQLLQKEGYATDSRYAEKLIRVMNQEEPRGVPTFSPHSPFDLQISANFQYGELCKWDERRRFQHQYQCKTALELVGFAEDLRRAFGGRSVLITSGYRPDPVNRAVGGASNSEHLFSAPGVGALDLYVDGAPIREVQDWICKHWPYSVGYGAARGFVHVGRRADGKRRRWNY